MVYFSAVNLLFIRIRLNSFCEHASQRSNIFVGEPTHNIIDIVPESVEGIAILKLSHRHGIGFMSVPHSGRTL